MRFEAVIRVAQMQLFPYIRGKAASGRKFWETVFNSQRPKLKLEVTRIAVESLMNTGTDVSMIIQKYLEF